MRPLPLVPAGSGSGRENVRGKYITVPSQADLFSSVGWAAMRRARVTGGACCAP